MVIKTSRWEVAVVVNGGRELKFPLSKMRSVRGEVPVHPMKLGQEETGRSNYSRVLKVKVATDLSRRRVGAEGGDQERRMSQGRRKGETLLGS